MHQVEPDELRDLIQVRADGDHTSSRFSTVTTNLPLTSAFIKPLPVEPTLEQSDTLLRYFFDCINPFTRVLHTAHFSRMLVRHRRNPQEPAEGMTALLYSIYALTISAMSSEVFERTFHEDRATWLERFQVGAEQALTHNGLHKTNNVFTLVAMIHYLVCSVELL